ncbi:recombinase family protein [Alkalibaculum sp. M08DMB]|uniref:Recombinase family protein n=1 Tax=Alkalibaculum sporogenes TaxID=2655001 RepID=A0A6A7KAC0_9FIRM|nr:recombinase family protein [Alkalibaculum sporogenes]MPW25983.1 recombinase family protein [Alkalibaculum sporogenes]
MKAVIYARYSPGPQQREESIEGQLRECKEFAKANEITVVGEYIDRALTGRNDNRADFQKMIRDSEKKIFDAVIVWKVDRFGRSREEIAINKVKFRKNGVKVLYAKEHIPDGPEGIILESVLEGMAEYYSANLSQNIKRGMKENALKGKITGGNIALGYKVNDDKTFEVDPDTAPIVIQIFQMYDEGHTITEIITHLNSKGYKTSRGVPFNKNSLRPILTNVKYIGLYKYEGIYMQSTVPEIVDKDLFERVQVKMVKNKKAPARAKAKIEYLLTTKLFCGHCGSNMVGESGSGRNQKYYYYICTKKKREKACDKKTVKKDWIEDLVINETVNRVLQDDIIELIADNVIKIQESDKESSSLKYLQGNLKETDKGIKNIMKAIEQGVISDALTNRLMELEGQKAEIEINIDQEKISNVILTKEQIIFWLEQFKNGDVNDLEYRKRIIDVFVNAVFLQDDKVIITYNYTNGTKTINVSDLTVSPPPKYASSLKAREHILVEISGGS